MAASVIPSNALLLVLRVANIQSDAFLVEKIATQLEICDGMQEHAGEKRLSRKQMMQKMSRKLVPRL
jgi:hypothetical protein